MITSDPSTNTVVFTLSGEFDHGTSVALLDDVARVARTHGGSDWVIDAVQLRFLDASLLRLLAGFDAVRQGPHTISVLPNPMLTKLLGIVGWSNRWPAACPMNAQAAGWQNESGATLTATGATRESAS